MEVDDKIIEIRLSKVGIYKEILGQILKQKNKNYSWVLVKSVMKIILIVVLLLLTALGQSCSFDNSRNNLEY